MYLPLPRGTWCTISLPSQSLLKSIYASNACHQIEDMWRNAGKQIPDWRDSSCSTALILQSVLIKTAIWYRKWVFILDFFGYLRSFTGDVSGQSLNEDWQWSFVSSPEGRVHWLFCVHMYRWGINFRETIFVVKIRRESCFSFKLKWREMGEKRMNKENLKKKSIFLRWFWFSKQVQFINPPVVKSNIISPLLRELYQLKGKRILCLD